MLRTLENWSPVYKSCGSNTCERWTQSVEPKTSHSGCWSHPRRWRVTARIRQPLCLYRDRVFIQGWQVSFPLQTENSWGTTGRRRGKGRGTQQHLECNAGNREGISAVCRAETPLKITEKVIAGLEGRKDFVAIFVIESWRDWGCTHRDLSINTHIFSTAELTHMEFSSIAIYTFTLFHRKTNAVILYTKISP